MAVLIVLIWSAVCAGYDLKFRRLPNLLTLGAHIPAIGVLIWTGQGLLGSDAKSCLIAWCLAIVLTLPAYIVKWLGAGDVKLLSAIALVGGFKIMAFSYVIAALLSVMSLLAAHFLPQLLRQDSVSATSSLPSLAYKIPFGTFLATGLILTVVSL